MDKIRETLAREVSDNIEEVIKVDQDDEQVIADEISEYVITDSIMEGYLRILDCYNETPANRHEGIGIWVSGFFGSGKSSFAKMLGLALDDRNIEGTSAASRLGSQRSDHTKFNLLLGQIAQKIPTDAVIFDVSTDRGVRSGNQSLTEITHRVFLRNLGYAKDLDIAQLEIELEEDGQLAEFESKYQEIYEEPWEKKKHRLSTALNRASRVMHELEPATYSDEDSWVQAAKGKADITPGDLARRCMDLMQRRAEGKNLVIVIDEVGQFVARDVQKMLDLQALVQQFGVHGKGKIWLVVTSQEKLGELVDGFDDKRVEHARLIDRFPADRQVHLEPSDISEVTSRRILSKNADGQKRLRELFEKHKGKLTGATQLTADTKLPQLDTESFIELYPLLPYQIDLIISIVSGLRTQGGLSKHVGGANRTIIKLAQQLLIHQRTGLADQPIGRLATLEMIYDLVSGNIPSEKRAKIDEIDSKVEHPLAATVAKSICLLEFVKTVHRTAENIAASLHLAVDADSRLSEVQDALEALEGAHMIRQGDGGYRIPSPAEDDWNKQRASLTPRPAEANELRRDAVKALWTPQPDHNFLDTKLFKAGLNFGGKEVVSGEITYHVILAADDDFEEQQKAARKRSQTEAGGVFWVAQIDSKIEVGTTELYRSKEILAKKQRGAQTRDESNLIADEKRAMRRHEENLRVGLRDALLGGTVYFDGNDRSPGEGATEVRSEASKTLSKILPDVYERYKDAATTVKLKDLTALFTQDNLRGLPAVFTDLDLLADKDGQTILDTEGGILSEMLAKIKNRTSYGDPASGAYLASEFAKAPYGWDFDVVRLLAVSLLRAGKVEATVKGTVIESAQSAEAKNSLSANNGFKAATFQPKIGIDFELLVEANKAYKEVFGKELPELEQGAVARELKETVVGVEEEMQEVSTLMATHHLPGREVLTGALDQIRAIRTGTEEQAITSFKTAHKKIKEGIDRSNQLKAALTEPALNDIATAHRALAERWPFLDGEPDLPKKLSEKAASLEDFLKQELFFQRLPEISKHTGDLSAEYATRHDAAASGRSDAYKAALEKLHSLEAWGAISEDQQVTIASPLEAGAQPAPDSTPIPQLRSDTDACPGRLQKAIESMIELIEGNRLVKLRIGDFFTGGIDTEEQLDAAIDRLREECARQIADGKKILLS